jgi:D-sedoheptulose 7-phosphate isomerase
MRDWVKGLSDHKFVVEHLGAVLAFAFDPAVSMLELALREGHKILFCGNGGSACDASHLAAELVVRFVNERRAYPAIALSADSAILTACANDYNFGQVFARQVKAYGQAGDVLVALSTSGRSRNVLEAVSAAKFLGMPTLGISGVNNLGCDVDIAVPSTNTARIQECTILCGHLIIESLEERLPKS